MGGKASIRGYFLQTLNCLVESLKFKNWDSFILEPDENNSNYDKVDIIWYQNDEEVRFCQIKSSKNINKTTLDRWVSEINSAHLSIPKVELIAYGNPSQNVSSKNGNQEGRVSIQIIETMNIEILLDHVTHKLNESIGIIFDKGPFSALILNILSRALLSELFLLSIRPKNKKTKVEFQNLISKWISALTFNSNSSTRYDNNSNKNQKIIEVIQKLKSSLIELESKLIFKNNQLTFTPRRGEIENTKYSKIQTKYLESIYYLVNEGIELNDLSFSYSTYEDGTVDVQILYEQEGNDILITLRNDFNIRKNDKTFLWNHVKNGEDLLEEAKLCLDTIIQKLNIENLSIES